MCGVVRIDGSKLNFWLPESLERHRCDMFRETNQEECTSILVLKMTMNEVMVLGSKAAWA